MRRRRMRPRRERRAVTNIADAEKKLRQATFFLGHLQRAPKEMLGRDGNPEHLQFYLSACLSAAKSVYEVLKKTSGTTMREVERQWREKLPEPGRFDRMMKLRNRDVHLASTEAESLPKYIPEDSSRYMVFGNMRLDEMENPDETKVSGSAFRGTFGLYLKQQGRRVEAATACREFIDQLGSLLEAMKVASRQDKAGGSES